LAWHLITKLISISTVFFSGFDIEKPSKDDNIFEDFYA